MVDAADELGKVASIEKVAAELLGREDEVAECVEARGEEFFHRPDALAIRALSTVSNWTRAFGFLPSAVEEFLQVADYWLVAHALAHGRTVVTHEVPQNTTHKVKIPNACAGLGIECINPFEMLRRERARFILAPL